MSTEKRVNIGMIGAGWWPNTMHMPALAACAQANVVAVCDLIPERAEALAKKYSIPHTFSDYKEMLAAGLCKAVEDSWWAKRSCGKIIRIEIQHA